MNYQGADGGPQKTRRKRTRSSNFLAGMSGAPGGGTTLHDIDEETYEQLKDSVVRSYADEQKQKAATFKIKEQIQSYQLIKTEQPKPS